MFDDPNSQYEITRSEGCYPMPEMHVHPYYELYYLEAGSREYFVEDAIFPVQAGEFVPVAPGKLHRTGGEYGMRTLVCFREEFLLQIFSRSTVARLTACFENRKLVPTEEQRVRLVALLRRMEEVNDEVAFALALGQLLQELGSCAQRSVGGDPVSAMVAYINANFASIRNISQIAERFYISKFHLCRVFKEAMKMTVVEYLNRVRVQNACRYLRSSDKDVAEVALLCGFHDAAYFSNVFKRVMGVTPSVYRREG